MNKKKMNAGKRFDEFDLHKEPELNFSPLSEEKYCQLYDVEMEGFDDDLPFYLRFSKKSGACLELGCGTGRLARKLSLSGRQITGIDKSHPMLQRAYSYDRLNILYIRADISNFYLQQRFDTIIIPYNTLNLLDDTKRIEDCLHSCHELLKKDGILLLQVFVPDQEMLRDSNKRTFQFQIFNQTANRRIIKETLKLYDQQQQVLTLEERYRIRTTSEGKIIGEDYNHTMTLLAQQPESWRQVIQDCGFDITDQYGSYILEPYIPYNSTCLLLSARPRQ